MYKMEEEMILKEINLKIRKDYQTINWIGIDKNGIVKLTRSEAALSHDFKYKGEGEYQLVGKIEFEEKVPSDDDATLSSWYEISPNNTIHIKEGKDCAEIEINNPIYLTKR